MQKENSKAAHCIKTQVCSLPFAFFFLHFISRERTA